MLDGIVDGLTGEKERVAQGGVHNHQYGAENCKPGWDPLTMSGVKSLQGWKDDAWPKDKVVFPNQICTMSQAIDLIDHLSEASVQSVNSRPEKQMDAMTIKNTNSAIIARSELQVSSSAAHQIWRNRPYRTTTLLLTRKKASLNDIENAHGSFDSIVIWPWEEDAGTTGKDIKAQVRKRGCDEIK